MQCELVTIYSNWFALINGTALDLKNLAAEAAELISYYVFIYVQKYFSIISQVGYKNSDLPPRENISFIFYSFHIEIIYVSNSLKNRFIRFLPFLIRIQSLIWINFSISFRHFTFLNRYPWAVVMKKKKYYIFACIFFSHLFPNEFVFSIQFIAQLKYHV